MRVLISLLLAAVSLPLLVAPRLDKLTLPKGFHAAVASWPSGPMAACWSATTWRGQCIG